MADRGNIAYAELRGLTGNGVEKPFADILHANKPVGRVLRFYTL